MSPVYVLVSGLSSSFGGFHCTLHESEAFGKRRVGKYAESQKRSKRGRFLSCESSSLTMKCIGYQEYDTTTCCLCEINHTCCTG